MIPESGEKSHGKEKGPAIWDISEAILQRDTVPRVSGIATLANQVCLPQMRLPSCISSVQWKMPVHPMPPSDLGDGKDSSAQNPYAVDAVVFGVLFCESGQARRFRYASGGDAWGLLTKPRGFMLRRIRIAIGRRDEAHQLCGSIEFDDAYFGSPTTGKSGAGAQKRRRFSWHCPWMNGTIPAF